MSGAEAGRMTVRDRIRRKAGRVNRELFLEANHDADRSTLVLGSGRSGTTWLAEVLARQFESRLLFEPYHPRLASLNPGVRLFLDPDGRDPTAARALERVLAGRFRHRQVDQVQSPRRPASRIVKDIHATNVAPWFRRNFPSVPLIYVLRHPIATAASRRRAGVFHGLGTYLETPAGRRDAEDSPSAKWLPTYDEYRGHEEPLVRLVAEWCIENAYPLSRAGADPGLVLTYYETAVLDPVPELGRLAELAGGALGSGRRTPLSLSAARRPSAMDWFGTAGDGGEARDWNAVLARWTDEVPDGLRSACLRVVADFGIESRYGEDPLPARGERAR
jgi:hypothetical protein